VRAGLNARGITDIIVAAWAGDGGTFDIGLQALSGAAERNNDIIYFCYDNEAYMNTGIQRSSATPMNAWTTTTPPSAMPKTQPKKNLGEIVCAHRVPYFATATVAYPDDFMEKVRKAKDMKGFRMIHILAPCPVGWRSEERYSILLSRLAVETRTFPLYEVEDGINGRLTLDPPQKPVDEYLTKQGRFRHFKPDDVVQVQKRVDAEFEHLLKRLGTSPEPVRP
jgi:pyruvate ferredoxin oxidoreductase beta subunit/2-oxoisovalerate ferredoxin oxidoreductase beta subunit